jgi:hypothetical protein
MPADSELLFVIQADGQLVPVTEHTVPACLEEDTTVLLEPSLRPSAAVLGTRPSSRTGAGSTGPQHHVRRAGRVAQPRPTDFSQSWAAVV